MGKYKRPPVPKAVNRVIRSRNPKDMIGQLYWHEYDMIEYFIRERVVKITIEEFLAALDQMGHGTDDEVRKRKIRRYVEVGLINREYASVEYSLEGGRTILSLTEDAYKLFYEADKLMTGAA